MAPVAARRPHPPPETARSVLFTLTTWASGGTVFHLLGTYGIDGDRAIVYVHYIDADIKNPRQIIPNLEALARADGAKTLRIEANVVNPKLHRVLMRYYEMRREGGLDVIEIRLAPEEETDRE